MPDIIYKAIRKAPRAKAKERLVGHEWWCSGCNTIVHTEPIIGNAGEESEDATIARHQRTQDAINAHTCPRKDK